MYPGLNGPRRVVASTRRVCLPSAITDGLGWSKGACSVTVKVPARRLDELLVELSDSSEDASRSRDPSRARRLDEQGQVTLPASLMRQVGLGGDQPWVYFASDRRRKAVRIIPQPAALAAWAEAAS